MRKLNRESLTEELMKEICGCVSSISELELINHVSESLETNAKKDLWRLIKEGLVNENSHLQQGVENLVYDSDRISICETPLQYPDGRLIKAIEEGKEKKSLLGSMTGVFVHVFDKSMYAVHVRGQGIAAPGKIQIVAGMGHYKIYPADNALKEVQGELGADGKLVLGRKKFLDVTPHVKAGKFPQLLFSYMVTGDLSHITEVVRNNIELEKFVVSVSERQQQEAYPFLVPMENLRQFLDEVDKKDKFYGPVKRTAYNFLGWYNKKFSKSY